MARGNYALNGPSSGGLSVVEPDKENSNSLQESAARFRHPELGYFASYDR